MREAWRILLLLTIGLLALLSVALVRFNPQLAPLQLGVADLPRWPVGWLVAAALWSGVAIGVLICSGSLVVLGLRLRRSQRELRGLQEELRRARSLPLRIAQEEGGPAEMRP